MLINRRMTRRQFARATVATGIAGSTGLAFPGISYAASRPVLSHGLQSGDMSLDSGMVWSRADRISKVLIDVSTTDSFKDYRRLPPAVAMPDTDYTNKRMLTGLPADQDMFYRVQLVDITDKRAQSVPVIGHFRTAPASRRSVRFAWSGDTAGQGWGIDTARGGMQTYATIASHQPDFMIHSGDCIYADGPIAATKEMPNGEIWNNVIAEGVEKVAESLPEFRGRYKYNLLDEHVRAFNLQVPTLFQWDDHEVVNNWSAVKNLQDDDRYTVKSIDLLSVRASRAFHEMTPIADNTAEPGRVYRKVGYGPLLDVFFIDLRSYRGPNSPGMQSELTDSARVLGREQMNWLKRELAASTATWKVIASDMPLGLIVWDDWKSQSGVEAIANGDNGPAAGRELEIAELLQFIKVAGVTNMVWFTADVHYAAAHQYTPEKAQFTDFKPFWEFVSGPMHAGTFGPNNLDMTFGPEVKFVKAPDKDSGVNLPPSMGLQFFGLVDIDGQSQQMTVRLMDRADSELYKVTLDPELTA